MGTKTSRSAVTTPTRGQRRPIPALLRSALGPSSVYDQISSNGAYRIKADDLDNDGYTDLVVPHYYNGSSHSTTSYVYYGSATGMSSSSRDSMTTPTGPINVAVGDLSGDGQPDLVFSGYYSGSWSSTAYSLIFNGSSSGYSSTPSVNSLTDRGVWGSAGARGQHGLVRLRRQTGSRPSAGPLAGPPHDPAGQTTKGGIHALL
ncbi:MAG: VCBS repeat-containing protein [Deltaproteobacteria bacterium]|nr:VCBS repeat-containing protein [Deltaproteobacteria bacterium]